MRGDVARNAKLLIEAVARPRIGFVSVRTTLPAPVFA